MRLELRSHGDLPRNTHQWIFGRSVGIGRREEGRALDVRVVIRAAASDAEHGDIKSDEQIQERARLAQVDTQPCAVAAERVSIRGRFPLCASTRPYSRPVRHANSIRPGPERHEVERTQSHANHQARGSRPNCSNNLAQETRPVLEAASIPPRPIHRAQKLMPQVTMTMLDIHESKACALRQPRGRGEIGHQSGNLAVAQQWGVRRNAELAVEPRVVIKNRRLQLGSVGPRKPAGMRELQADQQVGLCLVLVHECLPECCQLAQVGLVDEQLVRIGAAVVPDSCRLAAPDQLGAARTEPPPAPQRQLARTAIRGPIPPFHGQDGETVADHNAAGQVIRLRQRRASADLHLVVKGQIGPDLDQMPGKCGRGLQCCHAAIASHVIPLH